MQIKTHTKKGVNLSFVAAIALVLVLMLALKACSGDDRDINGTGNTGDNSITDNNAIANGENLAISLSEISETAKYYPVTVDGTRMEVVVVKAPDGTIRTAFNTCQVCNGSPKAYFEQSENTLQCQNCGNKFPMNRVGIEVGGCNPVPIVDEEKTVTEESITIPYETLQANAYRFPSNWKK